MATSSLQVAQILADLQTLQNADSHAAFSLLHANKTISPSLIRRKSQRAAGPQTENPKPEPPSGRRILSDTSNGSTPSTPRPTPSTPRRPANLSRLSSTASSRSSFTISKSRKGSCVETPQHSSSIYETDEDMKRANILLELYKMRGKVQQMGDAGLARAKARVDSFVARHTEVELADRERRARARHLQT